MSTSHHDHDHDSSSLPPGRLDEVSDGVFAWVQPDGSWFINNCGAIVGSDGIVSIDTCATERRTRNFIDAVHRVSDRPIRTLINTHHHADHTHGNGMLPLSTVIAHERCRSEMIAGGLNRYEQIWPGVDWGDLTLNPPFVTFDDRLTVWVDQPGGALKVELHYIGNPAHTTNDIVGWLPERKVLFSGDLVFNGGTPFVMMGSIAGSLRAVERLRSFGAEVIVPGHGGVCDTGVLDALAAYYRFVQQTAAAGKAAGLRPLETARETDLGEFAELLDPERIVGNLHRAYAEHDGAVPGAPIDLGAAIADMIAYNGGKPLRCLA